MGIFHSYFGLPEGNYGPVESWLIKKNVFRLYGDVPLRKVSTEKPEANSPYHHKQTMVFVGDISILFLYGLFAPMVPPLGGTIP